MAKFNFNDGGFPMTYFIDKEGVVRDYSFGYKVEGYGTLSNYECLSSRLDKLRGK
jgi:hypothetical protein